MQNKVMRNGLKGLLVLTAIFMVLGLAGSATAGTAYYGGTIRIVIGDLQPAFIDGRGVASWTGTGTHLNYVAIPTATTVSNLALGGTMAPMVISGGKGATIIPVTDPEGIADNGILSVRITYTGDGGTLGPDPGPLTEDLLGPTGGLARICVAGAACGGALTLPLANTPTLSGHLQGAGVGGQQTIGGAGAIRISVDNRPWTILTGTGIDQPDAKPTSGTGVSFSGATGGTYNYTIKTKKGFVHGPASASSTVLAGTAAAPGYIQFVSPSQTTTNITSTSSARIFNPQMMRLLIVPEPGMMLLIASGAAGLVVLGRRRMKK